MEGASGAAVSAGGGGTSAEVTAGLQAQVDKLNELMRICKEDAEQARKEANESQAGVDGAYAEGREARDMTLLNAILSHYLKLIITARN